MIDDLTKVNKVISKDKTLFNTLLAIYEFENLFTTKIDSFSSVKKCLKSIKKICKKCKLSQEGIDDNLKHIIYKDINIMAFLCFSGDNSDHNKAFLLENFIYEYLSPKVFHVYNIIICSDFILLDDKYYIVFGVKDESESQEEYSSLFNETNKTIIDYFS
uniref:Uncharacterized protein n=1 Tax=viral metagenome TaxID=1070528 RepID=A0A6C0AF98_9ZZZZ